MSYVTLTQSLLAQFEVLKIRVELDTQIRHIEATNLYQFVVEHCQAAIANFKSEEQDLPVDLTVSIEGTQDNKNGLSAVLYEPANLFLTIKILWSRSGERAAVFSLLDCIRKGISSTGAAEALQWGKARSVCEWLEDKTPHSQLFRGGRDELLNYRLLSSSGCKRIKLQFEVDYNLSNEALHKVVDRLYKIADDIADDLPAKPSYVPDLVAVTTDHSRPSKTVHIDFFNLKNLSSIYTKNTWFVCDMLDKFRKHVLSDTMEKENQDIWANIPSMQYWVRSRVPHKLLYETGDFSTGISVLKHNMPPTEDITVYRSATYP